MTTSPTPNSGRRWPLVKADLGGCRLGALAGHVGNSLPSSVGPFVQSTAGSPTRVSRLVSLALNELPDAAFLVFDAEMRFVPCRGAAVTDNQLDPTDFEGHLAAEAPSPQRWQLYRPLYEAALRGESSEREVASPDGTRA